MANQTFKQIIAEGHWTTQQRNSLEKMATKIENTTGSKGVLADLTATLFYELNEQDSGLLVVGREYIIDEVLLTDNFANVGFVSTGVPFVASATTPTIWTNSTIVKYRTVVTSTFNNTLQDSGDDVLFTKSLTDDSLKVELLDEGVFVSSSMWCNYPFEVIDDSTILIHGVDSPDIKYGIKITLFE